MPHANLGLEGGKLGGSTPDLGYLVLFLFVLSIRQVGTMQLSPG
jgi:hypothetical protein